MPLPFVAIARLIDADLHLSWEESLALAQGVAAANRHCAPPTGRADADALEQFVLDEHGQVTCGTADCATISLSELALFLGQLLPVRSDRETRAPAGIQFAIARALGLVEAPPLVSVEQFSRALQRFERHERAVLLRGVFDRWRARHVRETEAADAVRALEVRSARPVSTSHVPDERDAHGDRTARAAGDRGDRRSAAPPPDVMRRLLREADRARFMSAAFARQQPEGRRSDVGAASAQSGQSHVGGTRARADGRIVRQTGPSPEMLRRFLREADRRNFELSHRRPARPRRAAYALVALAAATALGAGVAERAEIGNRVTALVSSVRPAQPVVTPSPMIGTTGRTARTTPDGDSSMTETPAPGRQRPAGDSDTPVRHAEPRPAAPPSYQPSASGRLVQALDVGQRPVFSPSFAQDSSAVFFDEPRPTGSAVMEARGNANGGLHVVSVINDGAKNYHPQLSPDGRTIAFDSDRDGIRGVYLASRDGHNVRRVSGPGYAAVPTWSPDGTRLAFIRAEDSSPRVWNIWLLELRSGTMSRVTSFAYGQPWGASWFPDGHRICYTHEDALIVRDLATGSSQTYRAPRTGRLLRTPAVSPDGRYAVFQVYRDGAWLIDFVDGAMRKVLDDPTAEEFAWSPDGREVAFHSRRDGQWGVWFMGFTAATGSE